NPPGVMPICYSDGSDSLCATSPSNQTHPLTFKPEFNDAFELGTKNTLMDGALTLNGDIFLYKYSNYQISQIVDRTSVNLNFDATVRGAELESVWEPIPGLRFSLAGGYENATLASGSKAIDLMDRTAGHSDWMVVKPFVTETSNCILPTYVVNEMIAHSNLASECQMAYSPGGYVSGTVVDPVTLQPYVANPTSYWGAGPSPTDIPASTRPLPQMTAKGSTRTSPATSFPTHRISPRVYRPITPCRFQAIGQERCMGIFTGIPIPSRVFSMIGLMTSCAAIPISIWP